MLPVHFRRPDRLLVAPLRVFLPGVVAMAQSLEGLHVWLEPRKHEIGDRREKGRKKSYQRTYAKLAKDSQPTPVL